MRTNIYRAHVNFRETKRPMLKELLCVATDVKLVHLKLDNCMQLKLPVVGMQSTMLVVQASKLWHVHC